MTTFKITSRVYVNIESEIKPSKKIQFITGKIFHDPQYMPLQIKE